MEINDSNTLLYRPLLKVYIILVRVLLRFWTKTKKDCCMRERVNVYWLLIAQCWRQYGHFICNEGMSLTIHLVCDVRRHLRGVRERVFRIFDIESLAPHCCGFESRQGDLDSFMRGSYPSSLWNVDGSTRVPACARNNKHRLIWGLPQPVKLESHHTNLYSVGAM